MPTPSSQERTDTFAGDSVFARATTGLLTADLDGVITSINRAMEHSGPPMFGITTSVSTRSSGPRWPSTTLSASLPSTAVSTW